MYGVDYPTIAVLCDKGGWTVNFLNSLIMDVLEISLNPLASDEPYYLDDIIESIIEEGIDDIFGSLIEDGRYELDNSMILLLRSISPRLIKLFNMLPFGVDRIELVSSTEESIYLIAENNNACQIPTQHSDSY